MTETKPTFKASAGGCIMIFSGFHINELRWSKKFGSRANLLSIYFLEGLTVGLNSFYGSSVEKPPAKQAGIVGR